MKKVNAVRPKNENNFLRLLLSLKLAEYKIAAESFSEIVFFLVQYSFLFEDTEKVLNSCGTEQSQLYALQENRGLGARYLDPRYSMWISTDPALGEYVTPDENKKYGVFDHINLNLYHYGGNNPIKFVDPTGMRDFLSFLYDYYQSSYGSEGADFLFNNDPSLKLMVTMDAASKGDVSAQAQLKWAFHEASRELLSEISEKSGYASIVFLAIGCPQGASVFGGISMAADGILAIDDWIQGNREQAVKNGVVIIAGLATPKILKTGVKAFSKSIQITIGSTGKYYEVGHRGAIKSEKALRKLLAKDIASGYFGQEVIPNAPDIIEQAVKVYNKMVGNVNE